MLAIGAGVGNLIPGFCLRIADALIVKHIGIAWTGQGLKILVEVGRTIGSLAGVEDIIWICV